MCPVEGSTTGLRTQSEQAGSGYAKGDPPWSEAAFEPDARPLPPPALPLHGVPEKETKDYGKSYENRMGSKGHHEERNGRRSAHGTRVEGPVRQDPDTATDQRGGK